MSRVIIAGGRDFANHKLSTGAPDTRRNQQDVRKLHFTMDIIFADKTDIEEIVSGGAPGADYHGEIYAEYWNLEVKRFPADWDTHGKAAGPIRNKEMAEYGDVLVAYWDGKSRGTRNMIDQALNQGLEVHVFRY